MKESTEKRENNRYSHEAPVLCANFNMSNWTSGRIVNCSQKGMHLVSSGIFYPGASVIIRIKNDSARSEGLKNVKDLRHMTIAEVRWCKPVSDHPSDYEVGVKYYDPWY